MTIPDIRESGHLPPGRYRATLNEVYDRFVAHEDFAESTTRQDRFQDLSDYLGAWRQVESTTKTALLRSLWLAGSFVSNKLNPKDIDLTPIIDGVIADEIKGLPGSGGVRKLSSDRMYVKKTFRIEPFPIRWHPIVHPFESELDLEVGEAAYLSDRGMMDDWWQRCRVGDEDVPTLEGCEARRGYLEVVLDG
ncbi:DUF6932 family protein [Gordonia sp. DT219]|uniref:DUF6932 family protein n=1 Tax=Gordonia sp. DT219 TaxID=3416658 RepID=UPI003CF51A3E